MTAAGRRSHSYGGKDVFFFFSNRLGCIGSLVISVIVTVILLLMFRVI
jgi:hypothetical protein